MSQKHRLQHKSYKTKSVKHGKYRLLISIKSHDNGTLLPGESYKTSTVALRLIDSVKCVGALYAQ
jgi:uncharacterized protein YegP (UPF0339 family)